MRADVVLIALSLVLLATAIACVCCLRTTALDLMEQARAAQLALLPLIHALFSQVSPIPVKAALSMMGLCEDVLRLPLTPMEEPQRGKLRELLVRQKLL